MTQNIAGNDEVQEWAAGAERLLVATARAAGIPEPEGVIAAPRRLVPALDGLLATIPIASMCVDDEFWNLNAQMMALLAQVLITERGARWVPAAANSLFPDSCVLEVASGPQIHQVDPAILVRQVLQVPDPSMSKLIALGEDQLDLPDS